jgi:glycosyltransferase involved in cell wall biosynthesis
MRILMLTQFYPPVIGGEERHVRNLSAELAERGHDVTVATLWVSGTAAQEEDGRVHVHRLRGTLQRISKLFTDPGRRHAPPFPDPELVLRLRTMISADRPDIVHAHNWLVNAFLPLKRRFGIPLVMTLHDYGLVCAKKNMMFDGKPCRGPGISKCLRCAAEHYGISKGGITTVANWRVAKTLRRNVDRFLAVSDAVSKSNGLADQMLPFEVIPNFVPDDIDVLTPPRGACLSALPTRGFILFVGDLTGRKGLHVLLQAYELLHNPPPLVVIGRESQDTPSVWPANVHVFKSWPHEAVMHAWSRCLFGVAPSTWPEPCATVVMEAMAMGKAIVVTDIGGMSDIVDRSINGIIISPDDVGELARAMNSLVGDSSLRHRLGLKAREKVVSLKSTAVVSRIEGVYRQVCPRAWDVPTANPVRFGDEAMGLAASGGGSNSGR